MVNTLAAYGISGTTYSTIISGYSIRPYLLVQSSFLLLAHPGRNTEPIVRRKAITIGASRLSTPDRRSIF